MITILKKKLKDKNTIQALQRVRPIIPAPDKYKIEYTWHDSGDHFVLADNGKEKFYLLCQTFWGGVSYLNYVEKSTSATGRDYVAHDVYMPVYGIELTTQNTRKKTFRTACFYTIPESQITLINIDGKEEELHKSIDFSSLGAMRYSLRDYPHIIRFLDNTLTTRADIAMTKKYRNDQKTFWKNLHTIALEIKKRMRSINKKYGVDNQVAQIIHSQNEIPENDIYINIEKTSVQKDFNPEVITPLLNALKQHQRRKPYQILQNLLSMLGSMFLGASMTLMLPETTGIVPGLVLMSGMFSGIAVLLATTDHYNSQKKNLMIQYRHMTWIEELDCKYRDLSNQPRDTAKKSILEQQILAIQNAIDTVLCNGEYYIPTVKEVDLLDDLYTQSSDYKAVAFVRQKTLASANNATAVLT